MLHRLLLDFERVPDPDGYVVRALLSLSGEPPAPVEGAAPRVPLNLSLVLDRSGSMAGEPIEAARQAAALLVRRLHPDDVASVVAYDDRIETVALPATGAAQAALAAAIEAIDARGSTNLSGGWLRGRELVAGGLRAGGTNRVLLLTDGLANEGITDPAVLLGLCREARAQGITTTTIGFGEGYDETLLRGMADAGGGNTYYIERPDQAADVFAEEIGGLLSLVAQNVAVEVRAADAVTFGRVHHAWPLTEIAGGVRLELGDLYAREPKRVLAELFVAGAPAAGPTPIAELTVHAHALTAAGGVERREVRIPVSASLEGAESREPEVRRELLLLEAARAREAALAARERGDWAGGAAMLSVAMGHVAEATVPGDLVLAEEAAELRELAAKFEAGEVSAADAKYLGQWAYATDRGKAGQKGRMARTRGKAGE